MNDELSAIFKSEYSNLIAVLTSFYGVKDFQIAEDIVSDTFFKAMKSWSHKGIPKSPEAWLRKVAKNTLYEQYRRDNLFHEKIKPEISSEDKVEEIEFSDSLIEDSQLRMIFVLCDPELKKESQLSIALKILCGFGIEEIAKALLSNKETITKKIYRAKNTIKEHKRFDLELTPDQYIARLDNVLRVIYLLFNEGYYSSVNEENIRKDICWEALRLALFLDRQSFFPKPKIHALIAMMCFHASRIEARASGNYGDLLYEKQDRSKWDKELINEGKKYLHQASKGNDVSKYHLEAAIAYWHTCDDEEKWDNILKLYTALLSIENSPIIAMNKTYALAKARSVEEAIREAHNLHLPNNHYYFCLLAELYRMKNNFDKEKEYLTKARGFAVKDYEKELIKSKLLRIKH
jgi:RNA polymerase sigma factor (sigma-70 family)